MTTLETLVGLAVIAGLVVLPWRRRGPLPEPEGIREWQEREAALREAVRR